MPLPKFFKTTKTQSSPKKFYITLFFSEDLVQAALWYLAGSQIVIAQQSALYQFRNDQDCLLKTDEALQELGPESENVTQTVFAFDSDWATQAGVAAEKKPLLQKLSKELTLKPLGFVLVEEALHHFLLNQDQFVSALVLYLRAHRLVIGLLKQGKWLGTKEVGRSANLVADVEEGLARAINLLPRKTADRFPAQILLTTLTLADKKLQEHQQQLLTQDWSEKAKFLQTPIIESLPTKELFTALVYQSGQAVMQDQGPSKLSAQQAKAQSSPKPTQASSFGVPVKSTTFPSVDKQQVQPASKSTEPQMMTKIKKTSKLAVWWQKLRKRLGSWKKTHHAAVLLGVGSGLLALLILALGWSWFGRSAEVILELKKRSVSKEVAVTIDPDRSSSDLENLILSAQLVSKEKTGQKTMETTGVEQVGEPAKGKVVLFNKTDQVKKFASGTVLKKGDLEFTLDQEVTVASASVKENTSGDGETKDYGQAEVSITAQEIGAESNLAKDTELTIENFANDTYAASIKDDLSGGASREVQVVSAADRQQLLADLTKELVEAAEEEFAQESGQDNQHFIPIGQVEQVEVEFDAETDDEAETLTLDLTVTVAAAAYTAGDLQPLVEQVLASEIPQGYQLTDQDPQILSSPQQSSSEDQQINLVVNVSAQAVPQIELSTWQEQLAGQSLSAARTWLDDQDRLAGFELKLKPFLAKVLFKKLPQSDKINLIIKDN
ncbi:MAG: hypothetical protein GF390_01540 [Candidatus Pacebacteria bacterium]|nr:hypothetical protein [Candidatus Paceibacterota bacterium]